MSINNIGQTRLVPSNVLGYSTNGDSSIQITPTNITIGGNLKTTPIYVNISGTTGITSNRFGGLNVNCSFDMNSNSINNILTQKYSEGINITDSTTDAQILSNNNGSLTLESSNNLLLDVNGFSLIQLTPASLNLTGINGMNINTTSMNFLNGVSINDSNNSIVGTNLNGLTLNSDTSITLSAPIINLPSNITLTSLSFPSNNGININDDYCLLYTNPGGV